MADIFCDTVFTVKANNMVFVTNALIVDYNCISTTIINASCFCKRIVLAIWALASVRNWVISWAVVAGALLTSLVNGHSVIIGTLWGDNALVLCDSCHKALLTIDAKTTIAFRNKSWWAFTTLAFVIRRSRWTLANSIISLCSFRTFSYALAIGGDKLAVKTFSVDFHHIFRAYTFIITDYCVFITFTDILIINFSNVHEFSGTVNSLDALCTRQRNYLVLAACITLVKISVWNESF